MAVVGVTCPLFRGLLCSGGRVQLGPGVVTLPTPVEVCVRRLLVAKVVLLLLLFRRAAGPR